MKLRLANGLEVEVGDSGPIRSRSPGPAVPDWNVITALRVRIALARLEANCPSAHLRHVSRENWEAQVALDEAMLAAMVPA